MRHALLLLSGIIASCSALSAAAQDYPSVCVKEKNGTEHLFNTEGFQLTYADGKVTVENLKASDEASTSFSLNELELMRFSSKSSASISVIPSDTTQCRIEIFSIDGILIGYFESLDDARAQLPSAVYIVKSDSGVRLTAL